MSLVQAAILGIVQGLTEFIPVSSSGHLVLLPAVLGWPAPGLAFVVAVHVGTLAAVVLYYRKEWAGMLRGAMAYLRRQEEGRQRAQILAFILVGSIPAAIVGLTLAEAVEKLFNSVALVAVALIFTGAFLCIIGIVSRNGRSESNTTIAHALLIGCAQALAVVPGISRSGATIVAGLASGLQRDWAARFAFLLSVPVIAGAGLKEGIDLALANLSAHDLAVLFVGILTSAIVGIIAIHIVVRVVHERKLWTFGIYCLFIGFAAISCHFAGLIR